MRVRTWWPALLAVLAVIVAAVLVLRPAPASAGLLGKAAPDWTLRDLSGHQVTMAALRGHPVVLNFWGTTCPPCRREVPLLQHAYIAHRTSGLLVVGLDSQLDEPDAVRAFAAERGVTYLMLVDPGGVVAPRYGVSDLPHTFFIDAQGIVRADAPSPFVDAAPLEQSLALVLNRGAGH